MILFKTEHVPMILDGSKTQTRRRWKKPRVKIGNVYQARTTLFGKAFALLKITDLYQEKLKDMPTSDAPKEGYSTMGSYMDKWLEINNTWDPDELVWVVNFVIINSSDKSRDG